MPEHEGGAAAKRARIVSIVFAVLSVGLLAGGLSAHLAVGAAEQDLARGERDFEMYGGNPEIQANARVLAQGSARGAGIMRAILIVGGLLAMLPPIRYFAARRRERASRERQS